MQNIFGSTRVFVALHSSMLRLERLVAITFFASIVLGEIPYFNSEIWSGSFFNFQL
jgi:hypothetical protein